MAFDGITTAAVTAELRKNLIQGRVYKIAQPENDEILLTVKTADGGTRRVLISAGASLPFVYFTETNKQSPMTAPNFCMLLRKHLQNGRITDISQPGLERIIRISVEHLNEMGDMCRKVLVIELMGKYSNIIFCDEEDNIIDAIKHVPLTVSSVREVLPGRKYFIPETQDKIDPTKEISAEDFKKVITEKAQNNIKAIYNSFTGFSPLMASELCFRAGIDGNLSVAADSEEDIERLYNEFQDMMKTVKSEEFTPEIVYEAGVPKDFAALDLSEYKDLDIEKYESISEVLETYYAKKNDLTRIRQRSADLRKIVSTILERDYKKLDIQSKQLKDTEKKDKYRIYGEMLNTYGYGVEEGAKSLTCENYYTNTEITVPLDPLLSAKDNAKKYFDRYQKLKRTEEAVTEQLKETRADISHLESVQNSLDIAVDEADLKEIRRELADSGYIKKHFQKKGERSTKSQPLHYLSSDGFDLYVGKNNYQNDELTFKFATGNDWWFHSKKFPGSHVIMKSNGLKAEEIPDRAFNEAGALAAYYSKARGQSKVEIDYVQKKEVKKPAGAKPGFVVYYTNYSMAIDSDISALKQL
ncbi:NFACT family protein [Lachnospiraceae bacterium C1.1]|nr:NFACT RNA binding domain-containing protein [Lachnospiraceae bacterium C1.1]